MGGEGAREAAELTAWLSLSGLSVAAEDSDFLYLSAIQGVSKSREQWLFLKIDKENSLVYQNYWPYESKQMLKDCGGSRGIPVTTFTTTWRLQPIPLLSPTTVTCGEQTLP